MKKTDDMLVRDDPHPTPLPPHAQHFARLWEVWVEFDKFLTVSLCAICLMAVNVVCTTTFANHVSRSGRLGVGFRNLYLSKGRSNFSRSDQLR